MHPHRPKWAAPGDVNAFFGLMLDNIADLALTVGLLAIVFEFPTDFALEHMVPGTAIGVLVGDLLFFWMAISLAKSQRRDDVTAMPLGLDTPSTFGMVFFVLGPAFAAKKYALGNLEHPPADIVTQAAQHAWHIGICSIVISGVFKALCAVGSNFIRRLVPRAGLLGSLTAVALVLISFLPLIELLHYPIAGLAALAVILTTLVAKISFPGRIPGALGVLLIGMFCYYVVPLGLEQFGVELHTHEVYKKLHKPVVPTGWLTVFQFGWVHELKASFQYLPIVLPFALGTVIGGIDCTESASAAGDDYNTNRIIGVEALATFVAGMCGGVIQTTPYIGHPAYKAMGGRAAYTLATALFVGCAGLFGLFEFLYLFIPKAAVFPILIFIGLEITAQSFAATPKKHYAAVALACVPALAALILIYTDDLQSKYDGSMSRVTAQISELETAINDHQAKIEEWSSQADSSSDQHQELLDLVNAQGVALKQELEAMKKVAETEQAQSGNIAAQQLPELPEPLGKNLQTLRMLSGGFIVTSLLWASALAAIIDRRLIHACGFLLFAAVCAFFGIIHSPLPGSPIMIPFADVALPGTAEGQTPFFMAGAYLTMVIVLLIIHFLSPDVSQTTKDSDAEELHA